MEANAGESFQMQIILPAYKPPLHARSSPTLGIRMRSIGLAEQNKGVDIQEGGRGGGGGGGRTNYFHFINVW